MGDPVAAVLVALGGCLAVLLGASFVLAAVYVGWTFVRWRRSAGAAASDGRSAARSAATAEWVSAGALLALHPLGMLDAPSPTERRLERGRPILLVPGFFQVRSSLALLAARLSALGLGPIYTLNLHPLRGGLDRQAEGISRRIDEIRAATGARHVDVVAHSTGGLAVRLAELGRAQPRIRRLVTLGTPHRGTERPLGPGPLARDAQASSDAVLRLPNPPAGQLVSIASDQDFVVPRERAVVMPVGRDIRVSRVGHLGLLTDRGVAEEVIKALGEDLHVRGVAEIFEGVEVPDPELAAPRVYRDARERGRLSVSESG